MQAGVSARCRIKALRNEARSPFAAHRAFVYHDAMKASIKRAFAWMCVAMLAWTACVSAADERATGGRVPTVTRLVKLFTEQEARSEEHTSELQSRFDLVC